MINLSVALVDNDQHVLRLLSILILLTKLPATTNHLLHPAPLAMLYCLKGLLSLKVSHHIPYLTTPWEERVQFSLANHTTDRSPTSHSSDTLTGTQVSTPKNITSALSCTCSKRTLLCMCLGPKMHDMDSKSICNSTYAIVVSILL